MPGSASIFDCFRVSAASTFFATHHVVLFLPVDARVSVYPCPDTYN